MVSNVSDALVSSRWLAENLHRAGLRVVDGSFKMPGVLPLPADDYLAAHIPGAVFFDIDEISDEESPLPHMLPGPVKFSARMRKLGLSEAHHIVVYDTSGPLGASRVWWMLRAFGHARVSVLDGGLKNWLAEGHPTEPGAVKPLASHFTAKPNLSLVHDRHQILANQRTKSAQVIDARAGARFRGEAPEPRAGLRSGHIPGSLNVDHASLSDPATGMLLPLGRLRSRFTEAGVDLGRPIVTSCGSGVSACVLALALYLLGRPDVAVYDGSWAEWGSETPPQGRDAPLPIETAAAGP